MTKKPRKKACQWPAKDDEKLVNCVSQLKKTPNVDFGRTWQRWRLNDEKTAKQCRERWNRKLDPKFKQPSTFPFTDEDDQHIMTQFKMLGHHWVKIGAPIHRSGPMVKARHRKLRLSLFQNLRKQKGPRSGLSPHSAVPAQSMASYIISSSTSTTTSTTSGYVAAPPIQPFHTTTGPAAQPLATAGPAQLLASQPREWHTAAVKPASLSAVPIQPNQAIQATQILPGCEYRAANEARSPARERIQKPHASPVLTCIKHPISRQLFPDNTMPLGNTVNHVAGNGNPNSALGISMHGRVSNANTAMTLSLQTAPLHPAVADLKNQTTLKAGGAESPSKSRKSKPSTVLHKRPLKKKKPGTLDMAAHAEAAAEGMSQAATMLRKLAMEAAAGEINPSEELDNEPGVNPWFRWALVKAIQGLVPNPSPASVALIQGLVPTPLPASVAPDAPVTSGLRPANDLGRQPQPQPPPPPLARPPSYSSDSEAEPTVLNVQVPHTALNVQVPHTALNVQVPHTFELSSPVHHPEHGLFEPMYGKTIPASKQAHGVFSFGKMGQFPSLRSNSLMADGPPVTQLAREGESFSSLIVSSLMDMEPLPAGGWGPFDPDPIRSTSDSSVGPLELRSCNSSPTLRPQTLEQRKNSISFTAFDMEDEMATLPLPPISRCASFSMDGMFS
eukprot:g2487.t1